MSVALAHSCFLETNKCVQASLSPGWECRPPARLTCGVLLLIAEVGFSLSSYLEAAGVASSLPLVYSLDGDEYNDSLSPNS